MNYRRAFTQGGTYFFTLTLANRQSQLLTKHIGALRQSIRRVKTTHPFLMDAIVILPEHLHLMLTLPKNDEDYPNRISRIKANFTRQIPKHETVSESRLRKGERGIWQRRYWEHQIRDDSDYNNHINYIHYNPVKHGHVTSPIDWPYSSIHRYIRERILPKDWGADAPIAPGRFGE